MGIAIESHGICAAIALVCCAGSMACGKDGADDSPALCQAGAATGICTSALGSATLAGAVDGGALVASRAGLFVSQSPHGGTVGYRIAFAAEKTTCDTLFTFSKDPVLTVYLCDPNPGTFAVGSDCPNDDAGASRKYEVLLRDGTSAESGTITVDTISLSCGCSVRGSFSASFTGEQVTGTFDAVACGAM